MSKPRNPKPKNSPSKTDAKSQSLAPDRRDNRDAQLTTNQGVPIENDQDQLKLGDRGPTLMEDFHFREKLTHFDHERIPERVVHAKGSGAYGYLQVTADVTQWTRAAFLREIGKRTEVFVRFSTVAGEKGWAFGSSRDDS